MSDLRATIETGIGPIIVKLFENETPRTVENFVGLATGTKEWRHPKTGELQSGRPLYDGTCFHRAIANFVIQGGDPFSNEPDGDISRAGSGGPGFTFEDEFVPSLHFDRPGLLAMVNTGPDTNGCQWFITEVAAPHLHRRHTIFGEVMKGFELVPKIARKPAKEDGSPIDPIVIHRVTITRGAA